MTKKSLICIGKIIGVHGVHGNLKVYPLVESLDLFEKGLSLILQPGGKESGAYVLERMTPHKNIVLLKLAGVGRNEAETLVPSELLIEKSELPEPEADTYYWDDIIGLEVYEENGTPLGTVASIIETGSNDVYVVKQEEAETLIPALDSVVLSIDMERNRMTVQLPEGLQTSV